MAPEYMTGGGRSPAPDHPSQNSFDLAEIERAYGYPDLPESTRQAMARARSTFRALAIDVVTNCPPGRARSLALTNLQTAKMYAVQSIAEAGQQHG